MAARILLSLALGLALGAGGAAAQAPGDLDYEPDGETVDEYERLGAEQVLDYDLDEDTFDEAADQAAIDLPAMVPPSGAEVAEFRAGLEDPWGGNLPVLWAYLNRIDPAGGSQPRAARGGRSALLGARQE